MLRTTQPQPIVADCPIEDSYIPIDEQSIEETALSVKTFPNTIDVNSQTQPKSLVGKFIQTLRCYSELWKTRLSGLVVITAAGGYMAQSCGSTFEISSEFTTNSATLSSLLLGTFLQSACANSFNQIMEVDYDALMVRTQKRPLPTGRISKVHAAIQAVVLGSAGTAILYYSVNPLTAALGASNIFLYTCVYTPMKRVHWLNTWVGTINGSIPPLMGATAVTNSLSSPIGWFCFAALYLWQIPHFMAISYKCRGEYEKAGYKMLPIQNADLAGHQALAHAALMVPLCVGVALSGRILPRWFAVLSVPLNCYFQLVPAFRFGKQVSYKSATRLFWASLAHLPVLFSAIYIARRLMGHPLLSRF